MNDILVCVCVCVCVCVNKHAWHISRYSSCSCMEWLIKTTKLYNLKGVSSDSDFILPSDSYTAWIQALHSDLHFPHFVFIQFCIRVDSIVTMVLARKQRKCGSILLEARRFAHLRNVQTHAQVCVKLVLWAPVLGVKQQGSRADNSALEVLKFRESRTISPRLPYAFVLCTRRKMI
jgi:hypothetical protein